MIAQDVTVLVMALLYVVMVLVMAMKTTIAVQKTATLQVSVMKVI